MNLISPSQFDDISTINDAPSSSLEDLTARLAAEKNLLSFEELSTLFYSALGEDSGDALLRLSSSITFRSDSRGTNVDDVLSSLYEALSPPEFDQTVQLQFGERRAWISEICKLPALYASLKASRISGVLDRHIHQMKIVVGARPIFLTNRDEIFSMEIHSSMSLVTSDAAENEEHHTFNLTLEEINNLIRECEAAKKKIDALQEKFEGVVSVKVRL